MSHGHYTAYCLNAKNKEWFYFDDSAVTNEPNENNVVTDAAYLLFY
jgi:ubiquitin C-terminal hydrolase